MYAYIPLAPRIGKRFRYRQILDVERKVRTIMDEHFEHNGVVSELQSSRRVEERNTS
jgi:hypothetical protein